MPSSQFLNSLTPEALLLAIGSVGLHLCRFFSRKILAFHEEWFASTLFHHISRECSIGLRQIYDISLEQFVLSSAIRVIFIQVNLPLNIDARHKARAQGSPSLAIGRVPRVTATGQQPRRREGQLRARLVAQGSATGRAVRGSGPRARRPDVTKQTAGIKKSSCFLFCIQKWPVILGRDGSEIYGVLRFLADCRGLH